MTTNQIERVPDDELDQMVWKLERDGMTPKQLSLMKELREVRRAKGVYQVMYGEFWRDVTDEQYHDHAIHESPIRIVYPTPPVPPAYKKTENFTDYHAGWNACRAAMLQSSGNSEQLEPVSNRDELPAKCWCQTCRPVTMNNMRFVVCPECGNKRCPRANDHRNSCTGSNAPGQDGSAYPAAPNFREITETSTNCPKCGGRGTYHCPQMLGAVECECTLPAAPKEVEL